MSKLNLQTFRVETKLRSHLGILALLVVPVFLALLALAKFSESNVPVALEHAQLARHIAAGDGFVTSVLRPLALALNPHVLPPPDLVNAPVYPVLLSGAFAVTGASTRVAAIMGVGFWLLTAWLVFGIVRYWWNGTAAGLATMFFIASSAGLQTAVAGLPQPVMALLVFGAIAAVFPKPNSAKDGDFSLALWQPAVAGVLGGLAGLTDYRLLPVALVLGSYLFKTQKRRMLTLTVFVGGLLLVLAPWWIRNWQVSGRVFGLYWYSALENTRQFPGESIWRLMIVPKHPLLSLLVHPLDLARKLVLGVVQYRQAGLGVLEPVTLLLCSVALFGASAQSSRRRLAGLAISSVILSVLFACLTRPEARLLLAWTPLLSCVAAAQLATWVQGNVMSFSTAKARVRLGTRTMRSLTYTGVTALVAFPLILQFGRISLPSKTDLATIGAGINQQLPAKAAMLTDVPAYIAWYLNRPALMLCQRESDLVELEKQTGKIAGVYLSPAIGETPLPEVGDWWMWVASSRGIYRDWAVVLNSQLPGILRLPQKLTKQLAVEMELEQLNEEQKVQHKIPQSTEAQTELAFEYLKLGQLREAQRIYQEVSRLDHDNTDALIGSWQTMAQLRYSDGTLRLAQLAMQVGMLDSHTKLLLEEATAHFEQLFAQRPGDPWLLLNLLICRSRLGQWKDVEAYAARLSQPQLKSFPFRLILAKLCLQQGEIARAAVVCDQLLQEHPDLPAAHETAGRVRFAQNKLEAALTEFETTTQLRPQWIAAHVQAGQICQRLQRYDAAAKYFETALQLAPNVMTIKLNLADVYIAQGKLAAAIDLYREILTTNASQPTVLNNLAVLLVKTGQIPEAVTFARQAVNLAPQNPDYRDTDGWVAFLTDNQNEALLHLLEAVRLAPQHGLAHFHLGKLLLGQGKTAEARLEFKRALECNLPADEQREAQSALAGK